MRLCYGGFASTWGFVLYLASTDEYQDARSGWWRRPSPRGGASRRG